MLWLNVSNGSSVFAYSKHALTTGVSGSWAWEQSWGTGSFTNFLPSSHLLSVGSTGTAVHPYSLIASSLVTVIARMEVVERGRMKYIERWYRSFIEADLSSQYQFQNLEDPQFIYTIRDCIDILVTFISRST
jgi:hypothetical protein